MQIPEPRAEIMNHLVTDRTQGSACLIRPRRPEAGGLQSTCGNAAHGWYETTQLLPHNHYIKKEMERNSSFL